MTAEPYLTYAIGPKGKLVHVDSVPNGLLCGCTCPKCNSELIAKNEGKHNTHHFAHVGNSDCVGAVESALHKMAKEILLEHKRVMMPSYPSGASSLRQFSKIDVECYCKELALRPDCVGYNENGNALWVEFKRSHEVDTDKATKIQKAKIECVEIDINECHLDPDKLRAFIENSVEKRQWIYCKHATYTSPSSIVTKRTIPMDYRPTFPEARHLVINSHGHVMNLGTATYDSNPLRKFQCPCCGKTVEIRSDNYGRFFFWHTGGDGKPCDPQRYLRESAKRLVLDHFSDKHRSFYISPFGEPLDLRKLGYTECAAISLDIDEHCSEYDLKLTRNGKVGDDTIYIHFSETDDDRAKTDRSGVRVIDVPIKSERQLLENLVFNDQLNRDGIKYYNFRKRGKPHGVPTFTLSKDGSFEYERRTETYKPPKDAIYEIQYLEDFFSDRDAKEYAVLRCLKSGKKVIPCLVCNHLERHEHAEDVCSLGYSPSVYCDYFLLYKFIDSRISSKYKDTKVKKMEYNPPKEGILWT